MSSTLSCKYTIFVYPFLYWGTSRSRVNTTTTTTMILATTWNGCAVGGATWFSSSHVLSALCRYWDTVFWWIGLKITGRGLTFPSLEEEEGVRWEKKWEWGGMCGLVGSSLGDSTPSMAYAEVGKGNQDKVGCLWELTTLSQSHSHSLHP